MRFISHWHCIAVVGSCLGVAFTMSPLHADGTSLLEMTMSTESAGNGAPSPAASTPIATASQQPAAPRHATTNPSRPIPRAAAPVFRQPFVDPQVTNQTRQALNFYGGYSARATLSQLPRRAPLQSSASQPARWQPKPFETLDREPTVSPYLNLYRDEENDEGVPNYFALVRPQLDQLEANRMQQREMQQLRGQMQSTSSPTGVPRQPAGGMPATGTAARYMDTAQFYGGWRR